MATAAIGQSSSPPGQLFLKAVAVTLGDDARGNYNRGMSFDRIARVRIELDGINPPVWRRVDVPLTITMRGLHDVIQAVMPFENCHLFRFDIGDRRYGTPDPNGITEPQCSTRKTSSLAP